MMLPKSDIWARQIVWTMIGFQLCGKAIVSSFYQSQNNISKSFDRSRFKLRSRSPAWHGGGGDDFQQKEQEYHNDYNHRLLPASSRICLEFSRTSGQSETPDAFDAESTDGSFINHAVLKLKRRDGIELYGREIVHAKSDPDVATMSFLEDDTNVNAIVNGIAIGIPSIWDATLVLQPDQCSTEALFAQQLFSSSEHYSSSSSCFFVAMNRFQVKEDCTVLFEERWSQRKSKLSYQPGFLGFSLLRKSGKTQRTHSSTTIPRQQHLDETREHEHDRYNYSTCTIWDSIDVWEQWRIGGGKTSHEASRREQQPGEPIRVPVSEWLEGPSSPIFWDGVRSSSSVSMIDSDILQSQSQSKSIELK